MRQINITPEKGGVEQTEAVDIDIWNFHDIPLSEWLCIVEG